MAVAYTFVASSSPANRAGRATLDELQRESIKCTISAHDAGWTCRILWTT